MAAQADIPIDPALLEEEQAIDYDLEDAEGEIVDETIDVEYQWPPKGHYEDSNATRQQFDVIHAQSIYDGYYDQVPREEEIYVDSPSGRPARPISQPIPFDEVLHPQSHSQYHQPYPPPVTSPSSASQPKRSKPQKSHSHDTSTHGARMSKSKNKTLAGPSKSQAGPSTPSLAWEREILCSFCRLGDEQNEQGEPQVMVTCHTCGRSGHPVCMDMSRRLGKRVMQYEWNCIECKICEACNVKGEDARLLFCDGCDRGWHSYCLNPPLARPPQGSWRCPRCVAEKSQPSTSQIKLNPKSASAKGKGKAIDAPSLPPRRAPIAPTSTPRPRGRPRKDAHSVHPPDEEEEEDYSVFTERRPTIKIKPLNRKKQSTAMSDTDQEDDHPLPPRVRIRLRVGSGGGGKPVEVESEEEKVPYGGVITGEDADTSKTSITEKDKEYFEKTRSVAESKLGGPPPTTAPPAGQLSPAPSSINGYFATPPPKTPAPSKSAYRPLRNQVLQQSVDLGTPGFSTPNGSSSSIIHGGAGNSEKISKIRFGVFDIDTWYSAPYPEEYQHVPDGRLWLCEFCLKYMKTGFVAGRHRMKCKARHPPGDEIYRKDNVVVFEVDGRKNKIYCQNLCLLAKMFLDHKTLYYDVEPFLFYVMTEVDELGARFVGYFSKEKRSPDNNVSCIMTLPVRQRKGWGQLLIDFSYLLSKKEGRVGGPERPLSGLGEVTYKRYWSLSIFRYLHNASDNPSLEDISKATSMTLTDVYSTLNDHDMIHDLASPPRSTHNTKTPTPGSWRRGRHRGRGRGSSRLSAPRRSTNKNRNRSLTPESEDKDKVIIPTRYVIRWDRDYVDALLKQHDEKGYLELAAERLKYHPFLVTRDPAKPPGTIAKATLMANNPNALHAAEVVSAQDEEGLTKIGDLDGPTVQGEDQATLDLVKALANESPQRNLRKRTSSELNSTPLHTAKRLRTMNERNGKSTSPRSPSKSIRQSRRYDSLPESESLRNRNGHANGRGTSRLQSAAEIGNNVDAEDVHTMTNGHAVANGVEHEDQGEESDDPLRLDTPNSKLRQKAEMRKMMEIQETREEVEVEDEDGEGEGEDEDAEGEDDEEYVGDEEDAEGEEDEEYVE